MAISFPTNPSTNEVYTYNGRTWRWTGEKWATVAAEVPTSLPSLTITGNLVVDGTSTTIATQSLTIEDNIIILNDGTTGSPVENAGIEVDRGDEPNARLRWNETKDRWEVSPNVVDFYPIPYVPAGVINMYGGSSAPTGWLLCDGSAVSRTTYSELFTAISTTYGSGDGSTTFNVPNLSGKVPVGKDSADTDFDTLGETGGSKTHTLTTAQLPSHTHNAATNAQSTSNTGASSATYTGTPLDDVNSVAMNSTGTQSANHTHGFGSSSERPLFNLSAYNTGANDWRFSPTVNTGTYQFRHNSGYNTGGNSANHSHNANTGNVSADHSHNGTSGGISANHTHNGTSGNQSASHSHDQSHKHNMAHTHDIAHTHTVTIANAGSDSSHPIVQPYIVLNYIIKV